MTNEQRHGYQLCHNSTQVMAGFSKKSEQATDRRFEALQDHQYECQMFKAKQQMRCQGQIQRNTSINAHNTQLLAIWDRTGGDPPQLLVPDLTPVPEPTPPKRPATRRADA